MSTPIHPTDTPSPHTSSPPIPSKPGYWVALVLGVLLTLLGLSVAAFGTVALAFQNYQSDGEHLSGNLGAVQSTGHAIVSPPVAVNLADMTGPGVPSPGELASFRVEATPMIPGNELFIGIGDASAVSEYLAEVPHSEVLNLGYDSPWQWGDSPDWAVDSVDRFPDGTATPAAPADQGFWEVAATGAGSQEITWDLASGDWLLVIMNADATRPVWVDMDVGFRSDAADADLSPFGTGLLIAGLVALVLGILLLMIGVTGLGRNLDATGLPGRGTGAYPARLTGAPQQSTSRWLWLVKWLLAIPHYIVIAVLGVAVGFTTFLAFFAILFTGRYPRSWFFFTVGVLRWGWRVGFYAYAALGTDRYPPFTLAPADYPADFTVAYPERLSRGLVLVKWWLLAIPHYIIVGLFTSGMTLAWGYTSPSGMGQMSAAWSVLGVMVLFLAVALLFTGRLHRGMFDFIMGMNRWSYRVTTYALLLRDEYPPFRLDQGPQEPEPVERRPLADESSPVV